MTATIMALDDLVAEMANREGGRLVLLTMQHHDTTCGGEWRTCRAELCGWVRAIAVPIVAAEVLPALREAAALWAAVKEQGGVKLDEIAAKIAAHLKRWEKDPEINKRNERGLTPYYHPWAMRAGSKVGITYVSFQGQSYLSKAEAAAYLAWIEAGNVGTHYERERAVKEQGDA